MTRRTRLLVYGTGIFILAVGLILTTAYMQGADPFHPRSRHIWAASLLAAAYASFRGVMIVDRALRWRRDGKSERPSLRGFGFGRREHAINKRMDARRARVEAAKARQDADPETKS
ncbi:MAG: hypothetical protein AAGA24_01935 [Pseudomonadota bacterium]